MATYDLIISNGTVVTPEGPRRADVGVRDGRIAVIGDLQEDSGHQIDAANRLVLPGGVDVHAHIEQMSGMGVMNADTWETATTAAAMGGTTTVIAFAAQAAGQRLRDALSDYAARARRGAMIDHAFHMIVRDTTVPSFASDLAGLIGEGHRSVKVFTTYNIKLSDPDILTVMQIARANGALVCIHAENDAMLAAAKAQLLAQGLTRPEHHAQSHPALAEVEAVERMCHFAQWSDQPIMLFHISCAESLKAVGRARARGAPVWAETCPHYLLMTDEVLRRDGVEGAKWMCSPPQRTATDQAALWQGLRDGELQVVSSDHAPYRFDATGKLSAGPNPDFPDIANGMPGLETRLPLMFDAIVSRGRGTLADFVNLTATHPAQIYGLTTKGQIAPGKDADLVIWDPARQVTYAANDLHDNVGYNPWDGYTVTGWPETVLLRGQVLVSDGAFRGTPGQGQFLPRDSIGVGSESARDLAQMTKDT